MSFATLLSSADMSASLVTEAVTGRDIESNTIRATYTGAPVGSLTVEGLSGSTWTTITAYTRAVSAAGSTSWGISGLTYTQYRVRYTRTSGLGSLTVTVSEGAEPGVWTDAPSLFFCSVETLADLRARGTANVVASSLAYMARYSANCEGGGVFRWDTTSTLTDNGGTIIQPTDRTGAGRWIRVVEGNVYNITWFGARGNSSVSVRAPCDDEYMACVNAVMARGGGTVYAPAGTYYFKKSNPMPKEVGGQSFPLKLLGDGPSTPFGSTNGPSGTRNGTCFRGASTASGATIGTDAIFYWPASNAFQSLYLTIEGIEFIRGDTGDGGGRTIFYEYSDPGSGLGGRLRHAAIRNCVFFTTDTTSTVCEIQGVQDVVVEHCQFGGGAKALRAYYGSRLTIYDCRTMTKGTDRLGFELDTCGESLVLKSRFEGSASGYPLLLMVDCTNNRIIGMSSEGSHQDAAIRLVNCHIIRGENISMGSIAGKIGIDILGASEDIIFDAVYSGGVTAAAGWKAISVASGCNHVRAKIHITDGATGIADLAAGAKDAWVRVYEHFATPVYITDFSAGMFDNFGTITAEEIKLVTGRGDVAGTYEFEDVGSTIKGIETAADRTKIRLTFTTTAGTIRHNDGTTTAGHAKLMLAGSVDFLPVANSTLELQYRANANIWAEIGRTVI